MDTEVETTRPLIVIIEDERNYADLIAKAIRHMRPDLDVYVILDERLALEFDIGREPAVICLDLMLPNIFGTDLLANLRKRFPDTPVIIITAVSNEQRAIDCLNLGAFGYLQKPFSILELHSMIGQALKLRQTIIDLRESEKRYRALYETLEKAIRLLTEHLKSNGYHYD